MLNMFYHYICHTCTRKTDTVVYDMIVFDSICRCLKMNQSVRTSFQWPCCNFGSISSTYELRGGRASGGCSDESLTVILKKDDMLIRMDASYLFLSCNLKTIEIYEKNINIRTFQKVGSRVLQVLFESFITCKRAV